MKTVMSVDSSATLPLAPTPAPAASTRAGGARWTLRWRRARPWRPALDFATFLAAFCLAYWFRFAARDWLPGDVPEIPHFDDYIPGALIFASLWLFYMFRKNMYGQKLADLSLSACAGGGAWFVCGWKGLIGLMAFSFAYRQDMMLSRQVYVIAWLMGWGLLTLQRVAVNRLSIRWRQRRGESARRVVLVGTGPASDQLAGKLAQANTPCEVVRLHDVNGELARLMDGDRPTDVALDLSGGEDARTDELLFRLLNTCEARHIPLYALPGTMITTVREKDMSDFLGAPLVQLQDSTIHPVYALAKRTFDVLFSVLVFMVGLPLWAGIALAVKCTSPGGVFFSQRRVGAHGRVFRMYKFRSMVEDADRHIQSMIASDQLDEPVFNIREDPRVTPVGWLLRRTSLDEIPQLWNVVRGEMSWIGPRPERQELVDQYTPYQRRRLKTRPGITGYQQVVSRGDPSLSRRIELDLHYMKRQGFWIDVTIFLRTIGVVVAGHGMKNTPAPSSNAPPRPEGAPLPAIAAPLPTVRERPPRQPSKTTSRPAKPAPKKKRKSRQRR